MAYTLIQTLTVGAGGASSIDFASIPSTFTDVYIVYAIRSTQTVGAGYVTIKINGVNTNLSQKGLYGNGSNAGSFTSPSDYVGDIVGASATSNTFSNGQIYIPNYAGTTNKSYSGDSVTENNATGANQVIMAGLWSQTTAINAVSIVSTSGTFVQYSTASLYGIK
jgi:hypothetical protein